MPDSRPFSFLAFLSHRYKSPRVNEYFFRIFREHAEVQFEVDRGLDATSVTRLERKIRAADAFVGLFPCGEDISGAPSRAELARSARYFRLELDIAVRARRPAIVFVDSRYKGTIEVPDQVEQCAFDHREVEAGVSSPSAARFGHRFSRFCDVVAAGMRERAQRTRENPGKEVAILLPQSHGSEGPYPASLVDALSARVSEATAWKPTVWPFPVALDADRLGRIDDFDWVVADVRAGAASGLLGYLHGRAVPTLRLDAARGAERAQASDLELSLYGAHEVGYVKDIVRWSDPDELLKQFEARLRRLAADDDRISTTDAAIHYFRTASKRNQAVFVSYAGADRADVEGLISALKARFQEVFDYRDGDSLPSGRPWLAEIFDRLARAAIGVALLSPSYFKSGNCIHEAQDMVARRDDGQGMLFFPIKLREEPFDLPAWMRDTQYLRRWEHPGPEQIVARLIEQADAFETKRPRHTGDR